MHYLITLVMRKPEAKPFEQNAENYPSFPNFFPSSSIIQNCLAFLKCLV